MATNSTILPIRTCAMASFIVFVASLFVLTSGAAASNARAVPLSERIQGADVVVVAIPDTVSASWRENAQGDRVIVSQVVLRVQEKLKGSPAASMVLEMEGGTVDGYTMRVSSLPSVAPGERAVFFLDGSNGAYHPHLKGLGILKLDDQDVVKGSSLSLGEIRRVAAEAVK